MADPTLQQSFNEALHHQAGRLRQAEQLYRQILSQQPAHAGAMHYHPAFTAQAIAEELGRWNIQQAEPLGRSIQAYGNDASPDRPPAPA